MSEQPIISGQSAAAAERSAHVTRSDQQAPATETRPLYWVELLDEHGVVLRSWQARFEAPPPAMTLRVRPVQGG